jgi:phage-related protein
MAGISAPGVNVETNWPLTVGVLAIVGAIVYILYKVFKDAESAIKSVSNAANSAAGVVQSAGHLIQSPIDAISGAVDTVSGGQSTSTPGSNSNLFYTGVSNFFTCGSISGC